MIKDKLASILSIIEQKQSSATLIAVSKYRSNDEINTAYGAGQRHFGENYEQELQQKAQSLPKDIKWHFIGSLQSNKCKKLAEIDNLYAVHTLDTVKKADLLDKHWVSKEQSLKVFIQINTSLEEQKAGVPTSDIAIDLAKHIRDSCHNLDLIGLMTIGAYDNSAESNSDNNENKDFTKLIQMRTDVAKGLNVEESSLQLSMGMSADYKEALERGSSWIRVGTTIFGERPFKHNAKHTNEH